MASLPRVQRQEAANTKLQDAAEACAEPAPAPVDHAELARLREQARQAGAAQGRAEGIAQGRAEGHAEGLAAGQARMRAECEQLQAIARSLPQALREAERAIGDVLVALARDVAQHVVHRTFKAQPELIVPIVQDLLRQEPALQHGPRLLLHPRDLELVSLALGTELASAGWQLRADESISRGGCLVQSDVGMLDATVEKRWARVAAAFDAAQPEA
jgi:flagellar assembly protein FliH